MGASTANDLSALVAEGTTNLEAALRFHFSSNHFPALPLNLIPIAVKIIKGEVSSVDEIELPEGISYKGGRFAPVQACIRAWHLDAFLLSADDYEQGDDDD